MSEDTISLEPFYAGWTLYQGYLVNAVAPLSSEQLALGAAPHLRTIGVLVAHIISARVWWFHHVLGEGSSDLASLVEWDDDGVPARTAAELVEGLEASWQLVRNAISRWTAADLAQMIRRQRRGQEQSFSRQWVVWHVLEHDLHHGGELSFTLGMHGLSALDI